jgi:phosphoglycerate dehydrogenase-like enzyme
MDNVFLSPHSGGATFEAEARVLEVIGDNLRRALDGEPLLNVVNAVPAAVRR